MNPPASVCTCPTPCTAGCACHPPRMGTGLCAFLKRYRDDLRPYAETNGERVALAMVESCDFLLIEADRQERGQR